MSFKLTGDKELIAVLTSASRVAKTELGGDLEKTALDIAIGSQERAPENTGNLVNAHQVSAEKVGSVVKASVTIDSAQAPYAVYMHEGIEGTPYNLGPRSAEKNAGQPHVGTGVGWKFLERSFEQNYRKALKRVTDRMLSVFRRRR